MMRNGGEKAPAKDATSESAALLALLRLRKGKAQGQSCVHFDVSAPNPQVASSGQYKPGACRTKGERVLDPHVSQVVSMLLQSGWEVVDGVVSDV